MPFRDFDSYNEQLKYFNYKVSILIDLRYARSNHLIALRDLINRTAIFYAEVRKYIAAICR